jgi:hypothetical protein
MNREDSSKKGSLREPPVVTVLPNPLFTLPPEFQNNSEQLRVGTAFDQSSSCPKGSNLTPELTRRAHNVGTDKLTM